MERKINRIKLVLASTIHGLTFEDIEEGIKITQEDFEALVSNEVLRSDHSPSQICAIVINEWILLRKG